MQLFFLMCPAHIIKLALWVGISVTLYVNLLFFFSKIQTFFPVTIVILRLPWLQTLVELQYSGHRRTFPLSHHKYGKVFHCSLYVVWKHIRTIITVYAHNNSEEIRQLFVLNSVHFAIMHSLSFHAVIWTLLFCMKTNLPP